MDYIENHGKVKKLFKGSWSGSYGYGYYAYVDSNGQFVIGEERGREGGELYRGEYKGEKTPWLNDIKKENVRLYNSIVKYFNDNVNNLTNDRFEKLKQIAKDEFDVAIIKCNWSKEEVWNAIHELSDIRAGYNLFDDKEIGKYHACSLAIKALREVIKE